MSAAAAAASAQSSVPKKKWAVRSAGRKSSIPFPIISETKVLKICNKKSSKHTHYVQTLSGWLYLRYLRYLRTLNMDKKTRIVYISYFKHAASACTTTTRTGPWDAMSFLEMGSLPKASYVKQTNMLTQLKKKTQPVY